MFRKIFWFILFFYIFLPVFFSLFGYDLKAITEKYGFWVEAITSPLFWMGKIPGLKSKGIFVNALVFVLIWWRIRFWKRKFKETVASKEKNKKQPA